MVVQLPPAQFRESTEGSEAASPDEDLAPRLTRDRARLISGDWQ
jgi:hypothetical protein